MLEGGLILHMHVPEDQPGRAEMAIDLVARRECTLADGTDQSLRIAARVVNASVSIRGARSPPNRGWARFELSRKPASRETAAPPEGRRALV